MQNIVAIRRTGLTVAAQVENRAAALRLAKQWLQDPTMTDIERIFMGGASGQRLVEFAVRSEQLCDRLGTLLPCDNETK